MDIDMNSIEKMVQEALKQANDGKTEPIVAAKGIDMDLIDKMIKEALKEIGTGKADGGEYGVFESVDEAVEASDAAQKKFQSCTMADRAKYIQTIRDLMLNPENLEMFSRMAVEETGIGNVPHKILKNKLAAEKTPGIEDLTTEAVTGDDGITVVEYCPFGVIGAITPTTNPTETVVCNSIGMLAAGNTVVFSPHPRATNVTLKLITMLNQALEEMGAPKNLIATVRKPSIENTNALMKHPKVRMLVATGGPGIVKLVLSSGKKAIGAGAGNPPVVVDETADIKKAAIDIVNGASFDNNVLCFAEKEIIAVDQIADSLIRHLTENGAYLISDPAVIRQLAEMVRKEGGGPKVPFVGKSAVYILEKLGITADESVKIITMEVPKVHPFVMEELLMPIIPVVRAKDVDEAIDIALVAEKGNRHTAVMHSKNVEKLSKMAKLLQTTIFVKNAPSYAGVGFGGEGHTTFTIAGPTGEGLTSAKSFCRKRRCVLADAFHIRNFNISL